jgi:phage-related protein
VLECRFYRAAAGREPVREWLKSLPAAVRVEIGSDIQSVQWRWPVGMPLVEGFGAGMYEVRTRAGGDIFRVLFCLHGHTMILLHGFQKKTRATPQSDLTLARRRMRDLGDLP